MKPIPRPIKELGALLSGLDPVLNEGVYAFTSVTKISGSELSKAIVFVRESEGATLVLPVDVAEAHGMAVMFRASWITLRVHSDLHAIGVTATVATALAGNGISCNVIAGAHHDHLFVPHGKGELALKVIRELQGMT